MTNLLNCLYSNIMAPTQHAKKNGFNFLNIELVRERFWEAGIDLPHNKPSCYKYYMLILYKPILLEYGSRGFDHRKFDHRASDHCGVMITEQLITILAAFYYNRTQSKCARRVE